MKNSDDDLIYVSADDLSAIEDHGSIWVFTGHDAAGRRVRFGVDHGPARGLFDVVINSEDPVPCSVEDWQILGARLQVV